MEITYPHTNIFHKSNFISSTAPVIEDEGDKIEFTRDMCESLAKHVMHAKNLPHECMKFSDIVHSVEASDRDLTHPASDMS